MRLSGIRRVFLSALTVGLVMLAGPFAAQADDLPFYVGETLTFKLYYGSFLAGEQRMTITERTQYQGRAAFKIVVQMDTAGLGKFFKYKESGVLYLDEKGFFPLFARREIQEKDRDYWTEVAYNPYTKELVKKSTKKGTLTTKRYQAEMGCQEDISLYYYLRTRPWTKGDRDFQFLTKRGPESFSLTVKQGEKISTPMGKFSADKVETVKEGYTLWFSKDERALPLMIKTDKITCKLIQAE
jgi:hypothetical protein